MKKDSPGLRPASARAPPEVLARLAWFVVGLENVTPAGAVVSLAIVNA